MSGWFDSYNNKIDRRIDNDNISYTSTSFETKGEYTTSTTIQMPTVEVFLKALDASNKKLTFPLKQIIDDLTTQELNSVIGLSSYNATTPLGHAINAMNVEAVEYLLSLGVDTNLHGPNQKHILQELLNSNATEKRIRILEKVLKEFSGFIPLEPNYDGRFYSTKYLIVLINNRAVMRDTIFNIYDSFPPKQRKELVKNCKAMQEIAVEKNDFEILPDEIKDIFVF